jgi:hypothetical protein
VHVKVHKDVHFVNLFFNQLLQNERRYKPFLCEEESYLLELVRYIHQEYPMEGGLIWWVAVFFAQLAAGRH